jgi:hypothetical protein
MQSSQRAHGNLRLNEPARLDPILTDSLRRLRAILRRLQ